MGGHEEQGRKQVLNHCFFKKSSKVLCHYGCLHEQQRNAHVRGGGVWGTSEGFESCRKMARGGKQGERSGIPLD